MTKGASKPTIRQWQDLRGSDGQTVTALRAVRDDPESVWILCGRDCVGLIGRETATKLGLHAGSVLDAALIERADAEVRWRLARRDALRMLAARSYARRGLADALVRKGHDRADASTTAAWAADRGFIDDARFAEVTVRNELARRPAGRKLLEAKLRAKGVGPEDAARAIDAALGPRDELEDAIRIARTAVRSLSRSHAREVVQRRVVGRLGRRGFSGEVARRAVERVLQEAG